MGAQADAFNVTNIQFLNCRLVFMNDLDAELYQVWLIPT
jgi:hypothetical protein